MHFFINNLKPLVGFRRQRLGRRNQKKKKYVIFLSYMDIIDVDKVYYLNVCVLIHHIIKKEQKMFL